MTSLTARGRGFRTSPAPGGRVARAPIAAPARVATLTSISPALAVVLVEVVVPGGWGRLSWLPLVAGLLVGIPHGAVDHLLPAHRLGWRLPRLAGFAAGYATVAAVAWLAFRAEPGPALLLFIALSAWHFGTGETAFADLRAGRPVRARVLPAAALGALVLAVPLARGTADTAAVVAALVPAFQGGLPDWSPAAVLAVLVPAATVLAVSLAVRRRWLEAAEVAVLGALVLIAPPLAAFGVYFGCWHSVRHLARVVTDDPANRADLAADRIGRPLRRFAVQAALPTTAVLVVLGLLWSAAGGWRGFVVVDLPVLAALTLPHSLVVTWLDRAGQ